MLTYGRTAKWAFMCIIGMYMALIISNLVSTYGTTRDILVEDKQPNGTVSINNQTVKVPYRALRTQVPVQIDNPVDFVLLSTGPFDDNLIDVLLKLSIGLMAEMIFWKFDFTDPFNTKHLKQVSLICKLLLILFVMEAMKNIYTAQWCNNPAHGMGVFKYPNANNLYYIVLIWIANSIISFYNKAVSNQKELEYTI